MMDLFGFDKQFNISYNISISKLADQLFDRQCREIGHHEKFMSLISSIFVEKSEDVDSKEVNKFLKDVDEKIEEQHLSLYEMHELDELKYIMSLMPEKEKIEKLKITEMQKVSA